MHLVEGTVTIGGDRYPDVESFVGALDAVADEHGVTVQAFDSRYIVSRRHLERALELADRERSRGDAIARDRGVEVLLYAAGRRQIDRALEMGVGVGETPVVVLVDRERADAGGTADGSVATDDAAQTAGDAQTDDDAQTDGDAQHEHNEQYEHNEQHEDDGQSKDDSQPEATAASAVEDLLAPAETLGEYDEDRVRAFFDVSDRELAATTAGLEALVLERVALLVVER